MYTPVVVWVRFLTFLENRLAYRSYPLNRHYPYFKYFIEKCSYYENKFVRSKLNEFRVDIIKTRWLPFLIFLIHNRISSSVICTFKSSLSSFRAKKISVEFRRLCSDIWNDHSILISQLEFCFVFLKVFWKTTSILSGCQAFIGVEAHLSQILFHFSSAARTTYIL